MEIVSAIGDSTLNSLSYIGSLASLGARAAYYTLVAPFRGKPLRLQRAISQAMDTGVRALPILSLITFFIGLILALQAAYEASQIRRDKRRGHGGRRDHVPGAWAPDYRHRGDRTFGFGICSRNWNHEGE